MAKKNQSSIRYSDEVRDIIMAMPGGNFNQKLENMCLEYKNSIPERKKKIDGNRKKDERKIKGI